MRWLAVFLLGCSGTGPARPNVDPLRVDVVGDATFRARADGGVDVTVVRTFETSTGSGVATLRAVDLAAAEHSQLVRVATGRAWIQVVGKLEEGRRYEAIKQAVEEVGTEYRKVRPNLIDDTSKHLTMAQVLSDQGDAAGAGAEAIATLRARLALYLRTFPGQVE
jgi:hypothetical protein